MTKKEIEKKIKEILSKDKRYAGAKVTISYRDKENKQFVFCD